MLAEPAGEASPLDADRIMSGYWGVVAIWVTHPLWPFRVPLSVICSVIFTRFGGAFYQDGFGFFSGTENPMSSSHLGTEEKEVQTRMQKLRGVNNPQGIMGNVDFIMLTISTVLHGRLIVNARTSISSHTCSHKYWWTVCSFLHCYFACSKCVIKR